MEVGFDFFLILKSLFNKSAIVLLLEINSIFTL
jgi:hypothetical protein